MPKWQRTLRAILKRGESSDPQRWLNRFVAEREARDHCLPSTDSEIERTKGISFERREIKVVGYAGALTRLTAYRLLPKSIERARELLGSPVSAP